MLLPFDRPGLDTPASPGSCLADPSYGGLDTPALASEGDPMAAAAFAALAPVDADLHVGEPSKGGGPVLGRGCRIVDLPTQNSVAERFTARQSTFRYR